MFSPYGNYRARQIVSVAGMRCSSMTICTPGVAVPCTVHNKSSKRRLKPFSALQYPKSAQQSYPFHGRPTSSRQPTPRSYCPLQNGHDRAETPVSWRANCTTTASGHSAGSHHWDSMPLTAAHSTPASGSTRTAHAQQHMPPGWGSSDASLVQSFQQLFQSGHNAAGAAAGQQQHSQHSRKRQQQKESPRPANGTFTTPVRNMQRQAVESACLHFSIVRPVEYGQYLRLVGSSDALASWDAQHGPVMKWHEGHKWTADAELAVGNHEFKFVIIHRSGEVEWEPGNNRVVQVPPSAAEMQVQGTWGHTQDTEVLEVQEHKHFAERRHLLQQLLDDAVTAAEVDANAASAAAAAETLLNILAYEEQQLHGAAAAVTDSSAAEKPAEKLQQQRKRGQQQPPPSHRNVFPDSNSTAADLPAADTVGIAVALVNSHEALVSMLLEMRADLISSTSKLTAALQQVQEELGQVQEQVAQLTAERILQQQQQRPGSSAAAVLSVTASTDDHENNGFDAAVLGLHQQWMHTASNASSSRDGMSPERHFSLRWKEASSQASGDDQQQQQSADNLAGPVTSDARTTLNTVDILPDIHNLGRYPVTNSGALMGDHDSTVVAWRHEVLSFRQDAMLLRAEVAGLAHSSDMLEQQLAANTSALNCLKALVDQQRHQQHQEEGREQHAAGAARSDDARGSADVLPTPTAAPADATANATAAAAVEEQLLAKFEKLASELTAEVKHVVQAAVPQQQHIDLLQQLLQDEQVLNQLWTRPPPAEEHTEQQQQQHNYSTGTNMLSSSSSTDMAAAVAAHLLDSNSVQQYHKGLLFSVMLAAGMLDDGLLDDIKGEAMRLTWRGYKACWGDALLTELKQRLASPQQLLAELHSSSNSSTANTLACHVLWSLMELSTHSMEVAALLQRCVSISDMQLLGQLQPDAPQPNCAAVLHRWFAAAAAAGAGQ